MDAGTLMQRYFDAMAAGEDFGAFLTDDVTWADVDPGTVVHGRAAVREHVQALHSTRYHAHAEGRELTVTPAHAFLEGEFVADSEPLRVPFCLVYDLGPELITGMRLYVSQAALAPLSR